MTANDSIVYSRDESAYVFKLSKHSTFKKACVEPEHATVSDAQSGPIFGTNGFYSIFVSDNSSTNAESYCDKRKNAYNASDRTQALLKENHFKAIEIEVFQIQMEEDL